MTDTATEAETAVKDIPLDPKEFSIADYFRSSVTVPRDVITLYTDGEAAWEYEKVSDRQAAIVSEMSAAHSRVQALGSQQQPQAGPRSIADSTPQPGERITAEINALEEEHEKLQDSKGPILKRLKASGVVFSMRALLPSELAVIDSKAERLANQTDGSTPSDDEVAVRTADFGTALVLAGMTEYVIYPDGTKKEGPFKYGDFLAIKGLVDQAEFSRLVGLANALNTRQAFKDAQADAGFHS